MNNRKVIDYEIGFADSEILSYSHQNNNLVIYLKAWNEKILKFEFFDYLLFLILNSWNISDICELDNSPLIERALRIEYDTIPQDHPYKLYQFINDDDEPTVEIVSKKLSISREIGK